jgi:hypothetical protein
MQLIREVQKELQRLGIDDLVHVIDATKCEHYVYMSDIHGHSYGYPLDLLLMTLKATPPEPFKHTNAKQDERDETFFRMMLPVPVFGCTDDPTDDDMDIPTSSWIIGGHPGDKWAKNHVVKWCASQTEKDFLDVLNSNLKSAQTIQN